MYAEWQQQVDAARAGLAALGVGPGDRVAIVSRNSAGWAVTAYATYGLGATFVPMYEMQRPDDWRFILEDCGASVVFARTRAIAGELVAVQSRLPALRHVVVIEGSEDSLDTLPHLAKHAEPTPVRSVAPEDVAGLACTSGTTGRPKGVMLTHRNLTSNAEATLAAFPLVPRDRSLSFLP